jgi:hypothetical protein
MIGPAKWVKFGRCAEAAQPDKTEEDLHEEQCQEER